MVTNYERSLETLASRGVTVRRERVEALDRVFDMTARFGTPVAAEAYSEYRDIADSEKANELDRRVLLRTMGGKRVGGRRAIDPTRQAGADPNAYRT